MRANRRSGVTHERHLRRRVALEGVAAGVTAAPSTFVL
jgi:hypothetical protein